MTLFELLSIKLLLFSQAPVPNWLKEELFKSSALPKPSINSKELQQAEDDSTDKSFGKGDQADSKSLDSSKSTEEEDDEVLFFTLI